MLTMLVIERLLGLVGINGLRTKVGEKLLLNT